MCVCLCSVTVTGLTAGVSLHLAAVLHRTVVGHLDRLADVGFPALQHLLLVQLLVHPERHQLGARQPLPACTQTHRRWEILKQHNVVSAEQQGATAGTRCNYRTVAQFKSIEMLAGKVSYRTTCNTI